MQTIAATFMSATAGTTAVADPSTLEIPADIDKSPPKSVCMCVYDLHVCMYVLYVCVYVFMYACVSSSMVCVNPQNESVQYADAASNTYQSPSNSASALYGIGAL
jgi:hypothetical protein